MQVDQNDIQQLKKVLPQINQWLAIKQRISDLNQALNLQFLSNREYINQNIPESTFLVVPLWFLCGYIIYESTAFFYRLFGIQFFNKEYPNNTISSSAFILITFFVSLFLTIFISRKVRILFIRKAYKEYRDTRDYYLSNRENFQSQLEELTAKSQRIAQNLTNNSECKLPAKFWPYANRILELLQTGRAADTGYAMNLVSQEIRIQELQNQVVSSQQQMSQQMSRQMIDLENRLSRRIDDINVTVYRYY